MIDYSEKWPKGLSEDEQVWRRNLAKAAEVSGYSAAYIGRRSGMTTRAVKRILEGSVNPNLESFIAICSALGIEPEEIFFRDYQPGKYAKEKEATLREYTREDILHYVRPALLGGKKADALKQIGLLSIPFVADMDTFFVIQKYDDIHQNNMMDHEGLDEYRINETELYETAIANMRPYAIDAKTKIRYDLSDTDTQAPFIWNVPKMLLIKDEASYFSGCAIISPIVQKKLYNLYGPYYVWPVTIFDIYIFSAKLNTNRFDVKRRFKNVIKTQSDSATSLSDMVLYYDGEKMRKL